MDFTRRMMVGGALSGGAILLGRGALSQPVPPEPGNPADSPALAGLSDSIDKLPVMAPLPTGFDAGLSGRNGKFSVNYGAVQPPAFYLALARTILQSAPIQCRPIDVAYYFNRIRQKDIPTALRQRLDAICAAHSKPGKANPDFYSTFVYDWENNQYFNPVVVGFFRGVRLSATEGDNTAWCAAFANWCIARSRATSASAVSFDNSLLALGTGSASSGSFRCWRNDGAAAPAEGDIVVFALSGTQHVKCGLNSGHVGFLSRIDTLPDGRKVLQVIGGNQGTSNVAAAAESGGGTVSKGCEAVSIRPFGKVTGKLHLHAIRTAPFLR